MLRILFLEPGKKDSVFYFIKSGLYPHYFYNIVPQSDAFGFYWSYKKHLCVTLEYVIHFIGSVRSLESNFGSP